LIDALFLDVIAAAWIAYATPIPYDLAPDWELVKPVHRVVKHAWCAIDVSIVPSIPYLVIIEDAAATNSHHLVDDGLL
jgi:hypothetical protein